MNSNKLAVSTYVTIVLNVLGLGCCQRVMADDQQHPSIDWNRLNLTPVQNQQIQSLEGEWAHDYNNMKPTILDEQHKLTKLLADHNADTVEIMSVQQSIARKKEQLNSLATANYLKKRQILNETQQYNLEQMIRQTVANRQRALNPSSQTEVMPDRVQNLMQRVRNIWIQPER
jgi:hypothetical protein